MASSNHIAEASRDHLSEVETVMLAPAAGHPVLVRNIGLQTSRGDIQDGQSDKPRKPRSLPWNIGCSAWCRKYFWEGQTLVDSQSDALNNLSKDAPLHQTVLVKYRRLIGFAIPAVIYHFLWWGLMIRHNWFYLFKEKYQMTITMIFGGTIAGMTSEGGGAVAFPVMTLALGVSPIVARDFSFAIQSSGMSAASFAIFFMRVQLCWHALVFCSVGGVMGTLLGLHFIDPLLTPAQKKMGFVSIWFSFAFALFLLNRTHKRRTFNQIPDFKPWKGLVLIISGLVGGMCTSFSGSGLDICTFSILTVLFRVSEKIATPTSVVLMASNSLLGVYWRQFMMDGFPIEAWEYLAVCFPIVVIMAPVGSVLGTHFHRQVLASLIYILDTVALVGAFVLVPQTPLLAGVSCGIIVFGFFFFWCLTKIGAKLLESVEAKEKLKKLEREAETVEAAVIIPHVEKNADTPLVI